MPIRIVLADDHVLVRQGLKSLLEREKFQVMAEASDGQDAVRLTETHHPDITVMDISMPTLNGIDAARELARSCPKTKAILLTQHEEEQYIHEALQAGVKGYCVPVGYQRKNGGIAPHAAHAKTGHPRDGKFGALRRPPGIDSALKKFCRIVCWPRMTGLSSGM